MKKALVGCAGLTLVLLVAGGGALYFYVYKPFVSDYVGSAVEMAAVADMNAEVENQAAYASPPDGKLSAEQVERLVRVQEAIKTGLGGRIEALEAKYEQMEAEGRTAGYREVLGAWRDAAGLFTEAKRAQVRALNAEGFSLDEYTWVRREAYRAAGLGLPAVAVGDLLEAAQHGDPQVVQQRQARAYGDVPEQNRAAVDPHAKTLEENAPLAWFGL